jgi:glucokinase
MRWQSAEAAASMPRMILAADIGGTKTHIALFEGGRTPRQPIAEFKAASGDYPTFEALLSEFAMAHFERPARAVLGIAGPVVDNRCETTNLPWVIDARVVSDLLGGAAVTLMNDLEATAWGLDTLDASDLEPLHRGQATIGNRALIAAGTGLGEALLVWDGRTHRPCASEGGHVDFGPRDPIEDELNQWMRARYGRTSYERILSGAGLADVYRFMSDARHGEEPSGFAERFAAAPDPAALVTSAALEGSCERARLALERFVSIYGAEAGNLALKALAVGGVYVGGGIAPKILPALRDGRFVEAFLSKGRLRPVLEPVPVSVILDPRTALWGAASVALATEAMLAPHAARRDEVPR